MDTLRNMQVFVTLVQEQGFSAAAHSLNCSISTISKRLAQLEHHVGAPLLTRSTHGFLHLTEAGEIYFERARKIVSEVETAHESIDAITRQLTGSLKINVTTGPGVGIAVPAVLDFAKLHPSLAVEISTKPLSPSGMLKRGYDVLIRTWTDDDGELNGANVEVREIIKSRSSIYGAPSYFEKFGKPQKPEELANHHCLLHVWEWPFTKWWFREGNRKYYVKIRGRLAFDNWLITMQAASKGIGLVMLPDFAAAQSGLALTPVFEGLTVQDRTFVAFVPKVELQSRKVDAFLNFLSNSVRGNKDPELPAATHTQGKNGKSNWVMSNST